MEHKKSVVEVLHKVKFSNSIVTPKEILYDENQSFIGYTMPKQDGVELGKLLIGKVTDYFPEYTLIETLDIALSIIKIFEETKAKKVVVGDVNPRNILVANKDNVYLIDTDSFQLGENPSLAYMEEYRRPRHRGKSIQSYLRKYSDDCFAVATMIFQILHFGLLPYGGNDEQSLNESTYIFNPYYPEKNLTTNQVLIKAHNRLSENLKLAFRDIFKNDKYVVISTLKEHILAYKNMLLEVQKNKGG
jgi:DNA-binding helix-hairpin-helix protein with protein kinase domain